ncbi:hypothetical protein DTO013E5_9494 [Penicillium roqueforti]|uniref:Myb-like domain-containing protein n=1 Tax=Penicillium roqueforti (strain FM164) TaxID=1365484 RepID=W6QJY1_PENRF|nr:hypothetical protein DTO012A1_9442 [Penicillium roqueforti]CDM29877.1 hypothetical protein PROQFM164_S02g000026 [Penicillium roqueforti FM164]KAI3090547.1 hypothetical protein CBS147338_8866 [Penicillium roqueforti]KAI3129941.1 hypothetical protein CBS147325_9460 [Penicillium roqueforti]KAI3180762.1 hypothetical protein DTO032C6_8134 [Penicillium roqueforti]
MSNASFRLESFRPWNPFQDKAQPLRDSLDICRYPSPVSMTPTPPPSNPIDPVSKNQKSHSHKPGRHPLPARPPLEVCLDDGLHSDAQTTRHEPEDLGRTTFTSPHAETFDSEDLLQMQDLRSTEDIDSTTIPDNVCLGAEHRSSGFGSCDSDPAVLAGQHLPGNEAIDPAILDDHAFPGGEQTQTTENTTNIAICPDRCLLECSHSPNQDPPVQSRRQNAKGTAVPGRQSKINKRSSAEKRYSKHGAARSNKGPHRRSSVSFPTVRAQFSALPVEDRLEFLSWLFEGALSHCISTPLSTDATVPRCIANQDSDITYDCDQPSRNTELVDAQHTPCMRKGLLWSEEEVSLLVKLREGQNLAWSEVTRQFAQKFAGRSKGSIQVYWSTTLKKQRRSLEVAT